MATSSTKTNDDEVVDAEKQKVDEKLEKMMKALSLEEDSAFPACVTGRGTDDAPTDVRGLARLGMLPASEMLGDTPFPYHVFTEEQAAEASRLVFQIMADMTMLVGVPVRTPTLALLLTGVPNNATVESAQLATIAARQAFFHREEELKESGKDVMEDELGAQYFLTFLRERVQIINAQNLLEQYRPEAWPAVVDTLRLFHFYMRTIKLAEVGRPQRAQDYYKATVELERQWARIFVTFCTQYKLEAAVNAVKGQLVFTGFVHNWHEDHIVTAMSDNRILDACRLFSICAVNALENWIVTAFGYPPRLREELHMWSKIVWEQVPCTADCAADIADAAQRLEATRTAVCPELWAASSDSFAALQLLSPSKQYEQSQRLLVALARVTMNEGDWLELSRRAVASLVGRIEADMYDASVLADVSVLDDEGTRVPLFASEPTPAILGDTRLA